MSSSSVVVLKRAGAEPACDWYVDLDQYLEPQSNGRGEQNGFQGIVGSSWALRGVLDQVRIVAPTDSTVLIEGETGTGKEVIANAIHEYSNRRGRPLIKLNCAAIPLGLLESELFGHEKGAFTGAVVEKLGRFETANGGTLLDEIGDIPLELQSKLLRVLQEQEFERLGGSTFTRRVDVRVVAATNQDLAARVSEKQFRMDLYLPPQRLSDLAAAAAPAPRRHSRARCAFRPEAESARVEADLEAFKRCVASVAAISWPGNVRELQNFLERAVILSRGDILQMPPLSSRLALPPKAMTLAEAEREYIRHALEESNWVVGGMTGAAARLSVKRTTLVGKIRKSGLSRETAHRVI